MPTPFQEGDSQEEESQDTNEEAGGKEGEEQQSETIKIGDDEYTLEEAQKLMKYGKMGVEAEEKYDTDLSKVWPEYTKSRQELKALKEKAENLEGKDQQQPQGEVDQKQQMDTARKLLKEMGFMTEQDYDVKRRTEQIRSELDTLTKEIDGSDGRPKFRSQTVLEHMAETGIKSPRVAYKDMYESELDAWKAKQIQEGKMPGLDVQTESEGAAEKEPPKKKVTSSNLKDVVADFLGDK